MLQTAKVDIGNSYKKYKKEKKKEKRKKKSYKQKKRHRSYTVCSEKVKSQVKIHATGCIDRVANSNKGDGCVYVISFHPMKRLLNKRRAKQDKNLSATFLSEG